MVIEVILQVAAMVVNGDNSGDGYSDGSILMVMVVLGIVVMVIVACK